mgnify:FL=1|tara:strand:+ start:111 stop:608 length:498 start_codon:yes stop_codon:yes gene_type:complete
MAKYEEPDINPFDAPIPGQSLTDKPGNYPWEHPPKYTDFMEASTFIWNRIHLKRNNQRLLALINSGVPVESLVRTTLFSGFVSGLWNPDLAILLAPTIAKMYVSLAQAGGLEDITLDLPRKRMKSVVGEIMALKETARPTTAKARKEKFEEEVVKGLMSRKSEEE